MLALNRASSFRSSLVCGLSLLPFFVLACSGGSASTDPIPDPSGSGTGTGGGGDTTETTPAPSSSSPSTPTTPPTTPPKTPPTTPTTPPTTPTTPPAGCNLITNDATAIGAKMIAAAPPVATGGGAIPNGTYHLTDITLYTGASGSSGPLALSIKQTIAINGNSVDVAEEANGKAEKLTEEITLTGTSVAFSRVCPSAAKGQGGTYSNKGTSFVLYLLNDLNQTVSYTYSP